MKKDLDVCLTPALFHLHDPSESIVVVIDILRATSSICVGFHHGVRSIVPVGTEEESMAYRAKGYLAGAERQGQMVEGFDLGNSPFSYMDPSVRDRDIALTTTNGTKAIRVAQRAHRIAIGSFLNLNALCRWLPSQNRSVILLCSGWKDAFNLEDTLFAGAVVEQLLPQFRLTDHSDSALAALHLWQHAKGDLSGFLQLSSHRKRLEKLNIHDDVTYCLTPNQTDVIPVMVGDALFNLNVLQAM